MSLLLFRYAYHGSEPLYSGVTGTVMHADIFIGLVYYQRLRHMVSDKSQVCGVRSVACDKVMDVAVNLCERPVSWLACSACPAPCNGWYEFFSRLRSRAWELSLIHI